MTTLREELMRLHRRMDTLIAFLRKGEMASERRSALSMAEAAAALSISTKTLRRMVAEGRLRPMRVGRRVLVPRTELERITQPTQPAKRGHRRRGSVKARTAAEMAEAFLRRT